MVRYYRECLAAIFLLSIGWGSICCADPNPNPNQDKLNQLNQEIQQLQQAVQQDEAQQYQVTHSLKSSVAQINLFKKRLDKLRQDLTTKQAALAELEKNTAGEQQQLSAHYDLLENQMRACYLLMYAPEKDMSYPPGPEDRQRLLTYCKILDVTLFRQLNQLTLSLGALNTMQDKVASQKAILQAAVEAQKQNQQYLVTIQQNQQQKLHQLSQQLEQKNARLTELLANKHALEKLITKLQLYQQSHQEHYLSSGVELPAGIPFARLQGKLPWPTSGHVVDHFGEQIAGSELKYSGILIGAPLKQAVRAVDQGRVIFAGWLQGFGLLLIIEHDSGYISLYGRNEVLYKSVGQIVKAGELVGAVGTSSLGQESGLYFEIRYNTKPLDPEQWLSSVR